MTEKLSKILTTDLEDNEKHYYKYLYLLMMAGTIGTTLFFHIIATCVALFKWIRVSKYRLIIPLTILISGCIYPFSAGIITNILVVLMLKSGRFRVSYIYGLLFGMSQSILILILSFTRLLPTL